MGLPAKIFRFPYVGGDSKMGGNFQTDSFLMLRLFSYMKLGIMPAANIPLNIMPVDQCASLSIKLYFNEFATDGIYNVMNPVMSKLFYLTFYSIEKNIFLIYVY